MKKPLLELTEPDATRPPMRGRKADQAPPGRRANPGEAAPPADPAVRRGRTPGGGGWIA
jgi:hypothetical protein